MDKFVDVSADSKADYSRYHMALAMLSCITAQSTHIVSINCPK